MKFSVLVIIVAAGVASVFQISGAQSTAEAVRVIRAIGPEGKGNADASAAWRTLSSGDATSIVDLLEAMDGASPVALNWLRSAVDTCAARQRADGHELPVPALESFLARKTHHPRARRLAFELIAQSDPARAEALIATMLEDPSAELRREAVQRIVSEADKLRAAEQEEQAVEKYHAALKSARDVDQLEAIAKALKALKHPVKLTDVFGWVSEWKVIGPFDSTDGAGFERVFPPEERLDFDAEYDGKAGKVRWQPLTVTSEHGLVDLNKPFGMLKGVAGYACTEINSSKACTVEIRLGCKNAWKIWLNGKFLFGRDEYHRGMEIDQYRLKAELKPGQNQLLVKVCQNEQKEDWTKEWEFQLRITDDLGAPIDLARR